MEKEKVKKKRLRKMYIVQFNGNKMGEFKNLKEMEQFVGEFRENNKDKILDVYAEGENEINKNG